MVAWFVPLAISAGLQAAGGLANRRREQQSMLGDMASNAPPLGMAPPMRAPGQVPTPQPMPPMYPNAPAQNDRSGLAASVALPMASEFLSDPQVLERLFGREEPQVPTTAGVPTTPGK